MDKLQWFKFTPSDWMMGKIQRCPETTQARFMRLCCLYWNKECNLSIDDAIIEIDKEHFDTLTSKKIISKNDSHFNISFLDEQFLEIQESSSDKSKSGIIGNLKRWHLAIYNDYVAKEISLDEAIKMSKVIAPLSHTDGTPIATQSQIIADKIREENNREDEIIEDKKTNANKLANGVIEYYNGVCVNLPKVLTVNASRKKVVAAREKEYGKDEIKQVIDLASESSFLNGDNSNAWAASFDWIMKTANFTKILEGNYKNKENEKDKRNFTREQFEHSIDKHFPED
tara:strand:- start:332 stop:1186 length:855 start_codon:yes stop_codon:yes gene_type:complete